MEAAFGYSSCLTLRVKDLDLDRGEIRLRRGKGSKDRVTVLAEAPREPLRPTWPGAGRSTIETSRRVVAGSRFLVAWATSTPTRAGRGRGSGSFRRGVSPPSASAASAGAHHLHESAVQRAVAAAALRSGINKRDVPHLPAFLRDP